MRLNTAPATVPAAERRFVGLTALRWLPNGLAVPVSVLLAGARGLSLVEIGLVFVVHGVVVATLELPTGGLADAIGRRPGARAYGRARAHVPRNGHLPRTACTERRSRHMLADPSE